MTSEIRACRLDDMLRIAEMRQGSSRQPVRPGPWERGGVRVLTDDGQISVATLVEPLGEFFGGRSESVMQCSCGKGDSKVDAIEVVRHIASSLRQTYHSRSCRQSTGFRIWRFAVAGRGFDATTDRRAQPYFGPLG